MEIVNIEARTFEAMLSAFRTFADRLDTLCRLYGDIEEKKWLDNQEVCLLLKVSPRTLQTLRDRKSTRLNSSHMSESRMPSSA